MDMKLRQGSILQLSLSLPTYSHPVLPTLGSLPHNRQSNSQLDTKSVRKHARIKTQTPFHLGSSLNRSSSTLPPSSVPSPISIRHTYQRLRPQPEPWHSARVLGQLSHNLRHIRLLASRVRSLWRLLILGRRSG